MKNASDKHWEDWQKRHAAHHAKETPPPIERFTSSTFDDDTSEDFSDVETSHAKKEPTKPLHKRR